MQAAEPKWTIKQIILELCKVEPPLHPPSTTRADEHSQVLAAVQDSPDSESSEEFIVRMGPYVIKLAVEHFMGPAISTSAGVQELSLPFHSIFEAVRDHWGSLLTGDKQIGAWTKWLRECWWLIERVPGFLDTDRSRRLEALQVAARVSASAMEKRKYSHEKVPATFTDALPKPEAVSQAFHDHLNPDAAADYNQGHGRVWDLSLEHGSSHLTKRKRSIYCVL
ncbi:hypothetical protein JCM5350_007518 [Sporobolomyces pararoseus]